MIQQAARRVAVSLAVFAGAVSAAAQCGVWDPTIGASGASSIIRSLASVELGGGPQLYAGGGNVLMDGGVVWRVARWSGSDWSPLGSGVSDDVLALAAFDDGGGTDLYAGGEFLNAGGAPANLIARWNGTSWSTLGSGIGPSWGVVECLATYDDGGGAALYAGGFFTTAGGAPASGVARWNGTSWSEVGGGIGPAGECEARCMTVFDDGTGPALIVAGGFTQAGGAPANCIARWDGTSWSPLGSGTNNVIYCLAVHDDGTGPALYAGGPFSSAGGVTAFHIARWNGSSWSAVGNAFFQSVWSLASFDDGSGPALYAARYADVWESRILRWSGGAWSEIATLPYTDQGAVVGTMVVHDDGDDGDADLFAGGNFTSVNGVPSQRMAKLDGCDSRGFCFGDGTIASCPCNNHSPPGADAGCLNSLGTGGRLSLTGRCSLSSDSARLHGSAMPDASVLYFQGTTQLGGGLPFGDGLRCAGGLQVVRLGTTTNAAGMSAYPGPGDLPISVRGQVAAPGVRAYQAWYRNAAPFCQAATFNLTNGWRVAWYP